MMSLPDGKVQIEVTAAGKVMRLRVTAAYARRLAASLVVGAAACEPGTTACFCGNCDEDDPDLARKGHLDA